MNDFPHAYLPQLTVVPAIHSSQVVKCTPLLPHAGESPSGPLSLGQVRGSKRQGRGGGVRDARLVGKTSAAEKLLARPEAQP